jgi:hypothetical protein
MSNNINNDEESQPVDVEMVSVNIDDNVSNQTENTIPTIQSKQLVLDVNDIYDSISVVHDGKNESILQNQIKLQIQPTIGKSDSILYRNLSITYFRDVINIFHEILGYEFITSDTIDMTTISTTIKKILSVLENY